MKLWASNLPLPTAVLSDWFCIFMALPYLIRIKISGIGITCPFPTPIMVGIHNAEGNNGVTFVDLIGGQKSHFLHKKREGALSLSRYLFFRFPTEKSVMVRGGPITQNQSPQTKCKFQPQGGSQTLYTLCCSLMKFPFHWTIIKGGGHRR